MNTVYSFTAHLCSVGLTFDHIKQTAYVSNAKGEKKRNYRKVLSMFLVFCAKKSNTIIGM